MNTGILLRWRHDDGICARECNDELHSGLDWEGNVEVDVKAHFIAHSGHDSKNGKGAEAGRL